MKCYLNGQIVEESDARISIFDRSYLYGEGIFETLRSYGGKPAFLNRHFRRFKNNCESLNILLPWNEETLDTTIQKLIKANQMTDAVIRLTYSEVGASQGIRKPKKMPVNFSVFITPLHLDPKIYEHGVAVAIMTTVINDAPALAGIKSTNYLTKMRARDEATGLGVFEGLLTNHLGYIIEGSRTNFFVVKDGTVLTAPLSDGLLPGITREVILEIINQQNIPYREIHITQETLQTADELFLTGTTTEVAGIHSVRGVTKNKLSVGPITKRLHQCYREKI